MRKGRVVIVCSPRVSSGMAFLEDDGDEHVLPWISLALLLLMALPSCLAFCGYLRVPYGRYSDQRGFLSSLQMTSCKVPARLAWMVQEMPSVAVPLYLVLNVGGRYVGSFNPNIVLLGMFLLHYMNRCEEQERERERKRKLCKFFYNYSELYASLGGHT